MSWPKLTTPERYKKRAILGGGVKNLYPITPNIETEGRKFHPTQSSRKKKEQLNENTRKKIAKLKALLSCMRWN